MLPEERRHRIWSRLKAQRAVKTRELAGEFGVSNLTIHRDLQRLAREHPVELIRGGALYVSESEPERGEGACSLCGKALQNHQLATIILQDGRRKFFCCAHCGLLQWPTLHHQAKAILATDILHGITVNAAAAWFVVGTNINFCCTPPVFPFATRDHADKFVRGFGGQALPLNEAIKAVHVQMRPE